MAGLQALAPGQLGADASWTEGVAPFVTLFEAAGPTLFVVGLAVLAGIGWSRRRRMRADAVMGAGAQALVRAAIADAERRTSGEIVPVVLERSDRHPDAEWLSGLVVLLAGSALCVGVLPWHEPGRILLAQVAFGLLGFLGARALPGWKRLFVGEARATELAEEQALQEFQRQGLAATQAHTGVLLFVSLLERRVVVLADGGIHARVGDAHWQHTRDLVLAGIAKGSLADGLVEGVRAAGAVLAEHFPRAEGDVNELPDRLVVRRS